jgi:hypothetical protein
MTSIKILGCQLTDTFTAAQIALIGLNLGDVVEAPNHISRAYGMARYRLVKLADAVDAANKKCCTSATSGVWDVTLDQDGGGTPRANLAPIGMFIGVVDVSETPYCFVQISGVAAYTAGSASIIDGDYLMPDTENGDLTEATEGTDQNIVGWSIGTVADNAEGLVMLTGCPQ